MKFKKILAGAAACLMAASAMVMTVGAADVELTSKDKFDALIDSKADGVVLAFGIDLTTNKNGILNGCGHKVTDLYGMKITLEGAADGIKEDWFGGGIGVNSDSTGWKSIDWGKEGSNKTITIKEDGVIKYLSDKPLFAETDTWGQVWIQSWSIPITVSSIELLDKDGNVFDTASYQETTPAETTATEAATTTEAVTTTAAATAASTTAATTAAATTAATTNSKNPSTGDAGVALAVTAALAAAGAAVTFKKRK